MRGLTLAILALALLAGDVARYLPQLLRNAAQAPQPAPLLWAASQQGSVEAQSTLVDVAKARQQTYWLHRLVNLGNAEAAWVLYEMAGPTADADELMRLAAAGNVPEAQLAMAMASEKPQVRERWLIKAAQQGYVPAQAALADWYLLHQQHEQARPWLKATADLDAQSAFKYGRLLWESGDQDNGEHYLKQAAGKGHPLASAFTRVIADYQPVTLDRVEAGRWNGNQACLQRVQLFATSLSTIHRADALYRQFNQDSRLQPLPICLQRPIWLASQELACDADWQGKGRLGCDIRPLAAAAKQRDFTHAVILARQGKANVNNGVMFLDISDAYSVFVHELAHFSGFADEYPLSRGAARRYCGRDDIPNLVFDGALTYQPVARVRQWQALQPGGIYLAKTCSAIARHAYKPTSQVTFMEHHDSGVIPRLYVELWRRQLMDNTSHRPVYMNLFQAFHHHQQTAEADIWLKRYEAHRKPGNNPATTVSPP